MSRRIFCPYIRSRHNGQGLLSPPDVPNHESRTEDLPVCVAPGPGPEISLLICHTQLAGPRLGTFTYSQASETTRVHPGDRMAAPCTQSRRS